MVNNENSLTFYVVKNIAKNIFFQYWMNIDDADAGKCLRFLTDLGREEIESLDAARSADPGKRDSQRRLAEELTRPKESVDFRATDRDTVS